MRSTILLLSLAISLTACQAWIATPLVGYQQGLMLQLAPPSSGGGQCLVYGVPTPTGYANRDQTPLFINTPQNTGAHVLQFLFDKNTYALSPLLAPGQTTLQIDASDATNPLITFDASNSPIGQSGSVTVYLTDKSGAVACQSQIQFTVDQALSCLPTYGGVNSGPPTAGQVVVPSGPVYAPAFVQQTIIQQFVTINNININQVIVNVNQITNKNIINNIIVNPPSPSPPAPVNCTQTPKDPRCKGPAPTPVPPAPAPTKQPPAPTPTPCIPGSPTCSPPEPTKAPTPTSAPTIRPPTPTSAPTVTPNPPTVQPTIIPVTPTVQPTIIPVPPTPSPPIYVQPPQVSNVVVSTTTPPASTVQPVITYVNPPAQAQTVQTVQPQVVYSQSQASPPFSQSFGRRL